MKKQNLRKAALSALLMLVIAVVSLTGVTYAWFTGGTQAEVDNINVTVEGAAGGLQIAMATGENAYVFGSTVDFANTNSGVNYKPVSTNATALAAGNFFKAEIGSNAKMLKNITAATANTDYFAQSILIDNYGGDAKVLALSGTATSAEGDDAYLAIRIAIVIDGVDTTPEYDGTKDTFDAETSKQVYIYEPNATSHTSAGKNEARVDGISANTGDAKYTYFGIGAADLGDGVTEINRYSADEAGCLAAVTTYDLSATDGRINIAADALVKATIYVWVEGQDHDCHNDIAGGSIATNLVFTITSGGGVQ